MSNPLIERYRQAYRDLDIFPLLTPEGIQQFRVDYGNDTLIRLEQAIDDGPPWGKLVFAGHRGCGKSTLLFKFSKKMQQDLGYFVVFFSIAEMVEMSAVDHINILYSIAIQLLSRATDRNIPIPEGIRQSVLSWINTTRTHVSETELSGEVGIGADLKIVQAKLKTEANFREEITKTYERSINDLVNFVEKINHCIEQATGKPILVIIDDLDKLDLALVERIYRNNINALFQPKIRVIFTIPIAAIRDIELRTILNGVTVSPIQQLEVMKFWHRENRNNPTVSPHPGKLQVFLNLLHKRLDSSLLEPGIAEQIVLNSGGVMRELVRIARGCCSQCLILLRRDNNRQELRINQEILDLALRDLRNEFATSLGTIRYEILAKTYTEAEPPDVNDSEFLLLLHGLYILEYRNNRVWYAVHPIVVDLLRSKGLVS